MKKPKRPLCTEYYSDARSNKPSSKGFPKNEAGSKRGAAVNIVLGYTAKVIARHRETGEELWTMRPDGNGGVKRIEPKGVK